MADALNVIVRFVFEGLRLHRLEAACIPTNVPSQGVLKKCGFREEGLAREYLVHQRRVAGPQAVRHRLDRSVARQAGEAPAGENRLTSGVAGVAG